MTIIFDELEYSKNLLDPNSTIEVKNKDIYILGKYFRYLGMKDKEIEKNLLEFCNKRMENFNEQMEYKIIERAVNNSKKQNLRIYHPVYVTKKELDNIRLLNDNKLEKILFTMLVLSRCDRMYLGKTDSNYFVNNKFSYICHFSHVYAKKIDQIKFKKYLFDLGYIDALINTKNLKGRCKDSFKLYFADENSEKLIYIYDIYNLIKYYPFYCIKCGKITEKKSNSQKMCEECFTKNRKYQENERVKNYNKTLRKSNKVSINDE